MRKIIIPAILSSILLAQDYSKIADNVAKDLLKTLGGNLKKELKSNGPIAALEYCSTHAYNLTQKVSDKYGKNINIKRISLKPRNPANHPNQEEEIILKSMQNLYNVGVKPQNIIQEKNDKIIVYKPIMVSKKACLICHGDISKNKKLNMKIKNIYPNDQAINYKLGDFRGAIVIDIKKD